MKSNVIEKVLTNLYRVRPLPSMIHVYAAGQCHPLNPHHDEGGYDAFKVDHDANLLIISDAADDGMKWIDCDSVTSIEL